MAVASGVSAQRPGEVALTSSAELSRTAPDSESSAVVTLSGKSPGCTARSNLQDPGQEIQCNQVGSYLRDRLKVPCRAFVRVTVQDGPSRNGMLAVFNDLSAHGFFTVVGSVGSIRECDHDR